MKSRKNPNINIGATILILFFIVLFFTLTGRFLYIEITQKAKGEDLVALTEQKWTKHKSIDSKRGTIFDRNGLAVATDTPSYTVIAILQKDYPNHVKDPYETASELAPLLNMNERKIVELLTEKPNLFQVEIGPGGRNISHSLKEQIEDLNLDGISFIRSPSRFYPNGMFASHVIGFVSKKEDGSLEGKMGIENVLNEEMTGKDGKVTFQSDRFGLKLPDPKEEIVAPTNGNDVFLTIDQKIQTFLEDAMSRAYEEYEPEKIVAIVANPKTGEILAMGNRPSFDPNVRNITNYNNDAISFRYEPGSTMKVFTLAAAIEEGVFDPAEMYQSGSYRLSSNVKAIRDHNKSGWGKITFEEGVLRSSNVAFSILTQEKLGTNRLLQYISRFGLDRPTGIDLPGEVNSVILNRYPIDIVTTSWGQGSTITPIQQIQAATAIANQGIMMKPYVISKVVDPNNGSVLLKNEPEHVATPISSQTSERVLDLLQKVVHAPEGTGKPYQIEGYNVAGKTGTAQIPNPNGKGYLYGHGNNIFSFLGIAPRENPELLMYVAVKKPKLEGHELGSAPVAMIFKTVMKNSLHYLNITPKEKEQQSTRSTKTSHGVQLRSYIGENTTTAIEELTSKGLKVVVLGDGENVESQLPLQGTSVFEGEKVFLRVNGQAAMPDLTKWALRDVLRLSEIMELQPNWMGNGYVTKQNIPLGAKLKQGEYLVVELEPPFVPKKRSDEAENDDELIEVLD